MGKPPASRRSRSPEPTDGPLEVRIIGGRLRGTVLPYDGDPRVRPMKDRVRGAVFNLLADEFKGFQAIDLFAGTGALGIEAVSRGAAGATLFERHFPTAKQIERMLQKLDLTGTCRVFPGDAFYWGRRLVQDDAPSEGLPDRSRPWLVFCCPPYELFVSQHDELLQMLQAILDYAPTGSRIVVESDEQFSPADLPHPDQWQSRLYPPAVISLLRLDPPSEPSAELAAERPDEQLPNDAAPDDEEDEALEEESDEDLADEDLADDDRIDEPFDEEEFDDDFDEPDLDDEDEDDEDEADSHAEDGGESGDGQGSSAS